MADFNTSKVDGAGNTVAAAEWNQFADIDNFTISSGQTPSTTDLNQLGIASARYSSGGQFYTDSGTANAYVLTPVSLFKAPVDATNTYFNGMIIRFRAGNANTGASTVNVNGAGSKSLLKEDGSALAAGDIQLYSDVAFRYNGTNFVRFQGNSTITSRGQTFLSNPIRVSNNATTPNTDIDFTAGVFQFSDGSGQAASTAMTKRLQSSGSWSAGNSGNMLLTGARANSSTYHLFALFNPTTGAVDYGALLGVAGTTPDPTASLPSGYTKFALIASLLTDASGNIRTGRYFFRPNGTYVFKYNTTVVDIPNTTTPSSSSALQAVAVPLGLNVGTYSALYLEQTSGGTSTNNSITVQDFNKTTISAYALGVVKVSSYTNIGYAKPSPVLSNTSGQIWLGLSSAGTGSTYQLSTDGWETLS